MKWECFCDECYYGLWAVREVGEKRWGHCFHVQNQKESEGTNWYECVYCGNPCDIVPVHHKPNAAADLPAVSSKVRRHVGFSYEDIITEGCEGWLDLFWGDYPVAHVNSVYIADQMRKVIPLHKPNAEHETRRVAT